MNVTQVGGSSETPWRHQLISPPVGVSAAPLPGACLQVCPTGTMSESSPQVWLVTGRRDASAGFTGVRQPGRTGTTGRVPVCRQPGPDGLWFRDCRTAFDACLLFYFANDFSGVLIIVLLSAGVTQSPASGENHLSQGEVRHARFSQSLIWTRAGSNQTLTSRHDQNAEKNTLTLFHIGRDAD